jgi:hypothetical protein
MLTAAHADRGGNEKDRQIVEPLHVLDVEDAHARQEREQPDPDADHRGGYVMGARER